MTRAAGLRAAVTYPPGRDHPTAAGVDENVLARMPSGALDEKMHHLEFAAASFIHATH